MNSRDVILKALRHNAPPPEPLPQFPATVTYADSEKQFADAFTSVGGEFIKVPDFRVLNAAVGNLKACAQARKIASLVPGIHCANRELSTVTAPHELEGLDVAIIGGDFGVAENGAVWVPGSNLGSHRAVFVITQHVVLVLPAGQIVDTMYQAYERIQFERPGFGLFISRPSKTADIEQALVIGAHGARSCTLFLVG
ncbi:MAG: lactate utilization protein C [Terriglobales bacterium]